MRNHILPKRARRGQSLTAGSNPSPSLPAHTSPTEGAQPAQSLRPSVSRTTRPPTVRDRPLPPALFPPRPVPFAARIRGASGLVALLALEAGQDGQDGQGIGQGIGRALATIAAVLAALADGEPPYTAESEGAA